MKNKLLIVLCTAVIGLSFLTGCRQESEPNSPSPATDTPFSASDSQPIDFLTSPAYEAIETVILESFSDASPSIKYDEENSYLELRLTAPTGTAQSIASNAASLSTSWCEYTAALDRFCESMYQTCMEHGYIIGCGLMVCSDANVENVLYATLNGVTYYDAMEEAQQGT